MGLLAYATAHLKK